MRQAILISTLLIGTALRAQDTLAPVNVNATKKNRLASVTPAQSLSRNVLQSINARSAGDAAKYFAGVMVRDYGGVGGLKTISVRSLGAAHTGILYDGIPITDAQSGQVDLGKFPSSFIQSIELHEASAQQALATARANSNAALLSINSISSAIKDPFEKNWSASAQLASFGQQQVTAGAQLPVSMHAGVSIQADALRAEGDYPFIVENGTIREKRRRNNGDIQVLQAEMNYVHLTADSSYLQVKTTLLASERGLPGAVIFFNDRSVQRLWNTDIAVQSRFRKPIDSHTNLLLSTRLSSSFTRYRDPDFLNNIGGLNDRYRQKEAYFSVAGTRKIGESMTASLASDVAFTNLEANKTNFTPPNRWAGWNHAGLFWRKNSLQVNASLLHTYLRDEVRSRTVTMNKLTPFAGIGIRPWAHSPFLFRIFYKEIFRVPTFNDLYYTFIGSTGLKPEYARQLNAGITYNGIIRFSADIYQNKVTDKIVAVPAQNLFVWTMINLGKVLIRGLDVTGEIERTHWLGRLSYTFQQAEDRTDRSSSIYKNKIPYSPDHSGSGLVVYKKDNWSAGYSFIFSGARYALAENNPTNELSGWMTQDLYVSRLFKRKDIHYHVRATIENLFDARYAVIRYYPMPGRTFKLSLFITHNTKQ